MPSVSEIGDVVRVKREAPVIKNINLSAINPAWYNPSFVIFNFQIVYMISPSVIKIFSTIVKSMIAIRGFSPLNIYFI